MTQEQPIQSQLFIDDLLAANERAKRDLALARTWLADMKRQLAEIEEAENAK